MGTRRMAWIEENLLNLLCAQWMKRIRHQMKPTWACVLCLWVHAIDFCSEHRRNEVKTFWKNNISSGTNKKQRCGYSCGPRVKFEKEQNDIFIAHLKRIMHFTSRKCAAAQFLLRSKKKTSLKVIKQHERILWSGNSNWITRTTE